MYKIYIVAIFLFLTASVKAQDINPQGKFLNDSIKVGLPVQYSLALKYPRQLDVVFPDSIFNYSPFEYETKKYFPTRTDSLYSYDSAVYTLVSFEVDSIQYLSLPVFLITNGDSTTFNTSVDSVILHHVVKTIPDSLKVEEMPLKEGAEYSPLSLRFNYPYLIIGIIILIIVILLVLLIFGKPIKRWWKLRKMRKQYDQFQSRYNKVIGNENIDNITKASKAEVVWKNYMEKLKDYPYTKLTTKEIYGFETNDQLQDALRKLDKVLYSSQIIKDDLSDAFSELYNYTEREYNKKVEGIKHE